MTRADCVALDQADPLAPIRARFRLPEGVIYLDGNSLGALPEAAMARLVEAVQREWGEGLIRSWNRADWVNLPQRIGAKLARLLGADADEVIACDSTSVNLFKLLSAALALPEVRNDARRKVILSERGNFPTDLYMAQGLIALLGDRFTLKLVDGEDVAAALDETVAVAMVTQVDYCSGRVHDMAALNAKARKAGTRILWDLSHSAGALPVDLHKDGADFAVGCGYKYLNGGPGAPAYLYVKKSLQSKMATPLSGWFGHRAPFDFAGDYQPAPGIARMLCGTPAVLAMQALDCGIDTFEGVSMAALRQKSLALSDLFWRLMDERCGAFGFRCVSPREHAARGSQLSFSHAQGYAVMQALIDRGVIGDFRQPDLLRFGFTPLYTRFVDLFDAVALLREVMLAGAWQAARYQTRQKVT